MDVRRKHWSQSIKIVVSLLLLGLGLYALYRFSIVLKPLILAIILAYILTPLVNRLQARSGIPRGLAALLTYFVMILVLGSLPFLIIPTLVSQVRDLNVDIQQIMKGGENVLGGTYHIAGQTIDLHAVLQGAVGSIQQIIEPVFGRTLSLAVEVISSVVWVIFIFIVSFYLVKDAETLRTWSESLAPTNYRQDYIRLRNEIEQIWAAFFRGQLLLALVVAGIFTIVGLILGLPFALVMGLLAGLLELLASVGHGTWLLIAALLAFFVGSTWLPMPNWVFTLIVVVMHLVFQQFDLNYLIPRIIGRSVRLPPLVVILGVVTGAVLGGVLGILLAAPTIASARVIIRYIYANLFDLDPFPGTVTPPLPPPNPHWWRRTPEEVKS